MTNIHIENDSHTCLTNQKFSDAILLFLISQ